MSNTLPLREVAANGLWRNNAGLVQLLGLCPLLAVSTQVSYALGLGLATMLVLAVSNVTVSLLRPLVSQEIRIAAYVVVIAGAVSIIELLIRAYALPLHRGLGIFLPLIVTNCAILGRAEAFASRTTPGRALVDGLATGAGFAAVLVVLGAIRELCGRGTLFAQMHLLLGEAGRTLEVRIADGGLLLAILPPGAFIALGALVALHRWWSARPRRETLTEVAKAPTR